MFCFLGCKTRGISGPWPGIEHAPSAWRIKSLSLDCQESPKCSVFFIPKFSRHSGFTVPLTTLEKCAEIEALLSLLLWKGNRMEIMTLLEPGLWRASVSTSLEMRYSWCSLWRQRTNTIKATAKVSSHSPRAPRLEGKSTLGTASCLLVPGRAFPGWMFWKHRFEAQIFLQMLASPSPSE